MLALRSSAASARPAASEGRYCLPIE